MYNLIISIIVIGIILPKTAGQCTLPFTDGTWISSTRGTWTVSNSGTRISNFDAQLSTTLNTATLDCISSNGNQYILGTQFELFFMVNIDVFICLDIRTTSVSPNSYVYYIVTPTDSNTGQEFTSDQANACSNSNYERPINAHIVLKSGSETDAGITLPNAILGNYSLDYVEVDGVTVQDSQMDSCTDKTIMNFDNADSNHKLAFTSGDIVYGIHRVTSGSTIYLHTYNNDSSVDNINTFSIACWVIVRSGSQVKATAYPRECIQGQSSTSVPYGGQKFVFTPHYTCAPTSSESESSGLESWQIALIVLGILAVIFIVVIIVLCFLYARKARHIRDEKEGFVDKERQPSPDSLHGEDMPGTDKYNNKLDEIDWEKRKNKEKERTFFLKEVNKRGKKLQDKNPVVAEDKLKEDKIKDDKIKDEQPKVAKITKPTPRPQPAKQQQKPTPQPQPPPPQSNKQPLPEPIEIPPGKKSIPPTTPRPDAADTALLRIKKERERKERERDEKKRKEQAKEKKEQTMKKEDDKQVEEVIESKVIKKDRRSSSSEEYETDEEDAKERIQKLLEKRKRLEGAGWSPTGAQGGRVVGKKKRRKRHDGEGADDLTATAMTTREEQEMLANRRRNRKKNFKRMAKKKLRSSDVETTDTEGEGGVSRKRSKRRKVGGSYGVEAPYTKVYHEKKGIEQELDDMDFWHTKEVPTVISDDDESDSPDKFKREKLHVAPVQAKQPITESKEETSNADRLMREEEEKCAKYGMKGLVIGMDGALPDGFHFDDEGNIIRDVDGKKLPKEAYEKIMDARKKFGHVFSIPRLVRDTDGRPLGGYKNDEFGPYEEWDYGELPSAKEEEEEQKRAESQRPVSGKQVAFNTDDGFSVPATPLTESNYNQMKGRQLGSAERLKLSERLFEAKQKQEPDVPVFFANITKGGVKAEPVYIDPKQLVRQDCSKPPIHRASAGNGQHNMVKRSDTFDDGRMKLRRNTKLRSSWSGREATIPDFIPEENETEGRQAKGIQGMTRSTHNIGSVDEFVLVGGSMQKLDKTQAHADSKVSSKWCQRYERHVHQPNREPSNLTDVSMRTAPDSVRPFSGDDRRLRKLIPEFIPDQKYFQHYLDTEKLPTNAALETRGLASHGREYLMERAGYWQDHQPYIQAPPPSELGLRLSRMRTFHTTADSGMHSMISSSAGRPHSADQAPENTHRTWNEQSRETTLTNAQMSGRSHTNNELILPDVSAENTSRPPPTGRSDAAKTPSKVERTREKTVTINETPMEQTEKASKTNSSAKRPKQDEPTTVPSNVMSITDHLELM